MSDIKHTPGPSASLITALKALERVESLFTRYLVIGKAQREVEDCLEQVREAIYKVKAEAL